jgi:23S rRNA pseudouridine1911/1915/1917 synthase
VHLQYAGLPIIGDLQYGKSSNQVQRVMLHSKVTRILGYEFQAKEPKEFFHFGF